MECDSLIFTCYALVTFVMHQFPLFCFWFFFRDLLLGLLVFAESFILLTFASLINKGVGWNLAHWRASYMNQCYGGITVVRSISAGVLQGLWRVLSRSGREWRASRAARGNYRAPHLLICHWKARRHAMKWWSTACIFVFCRFSELDCFTPQTDALAQFFTVSVSQGAWQLKRRQITNPSTTQKMDKTATCTYWHLN